MDTASPPAPPDQPLTEAQPSRAPLRGGGGGEPTQDASWPRFGSPRGPGRRHVCTAHPSRVAMDTASPPAPSDHLGAEAQPRRDGQSAAVLPCGLIDASRIYWAAEAAHGVRASGLHWQEQRQHGANFRDGRTRTRAVRFENPEKPETAGEAAAEEEELLLGHLSPCSRPAAAVR
eukprot:scaffold53740_cov68-Phaeocystis_antarctica.AAC.11